MSRNAAVAIGRVRRQRYGAELFLSFCGMCAIAWSPADAHTWQCRAPDGSFAEQNFPVSQTATQFTGQMVIRKADGLSEWHPTAKVAFTDVDLAASGCHCNGIVATWYRERPDYFLVSLSADGHQIPLGLVPYDKPVTFKLTFAQDGMLRLEVGTGMATGRTTSPKRNNLQLSCSTASVDFDVAVAPSGHDAISNNAPSKE